MLFTDVIGELCGSQWELHLLWLCWWSHPSVQSIQPAVHQHSAAAAPAGNRPHAERSARVQILQTHSQDTEKTPTDTLITDCECGSTVDCYRPVQVLSIPIHWPWPLTLLPNTWPACTTTIVCMCGTLKMCGTQGNCTLLCTTAALCGASK